MMAAGLVVGGGRRASDALTRMPADRLCWAQAPNGARGMGMDLLLDHTYVRGWICARRSAY
jgi:hypothetical protein